MPTKLAIFNEALRLLGEPLAVTEDDERKAVERVRGAYDPARDSWFEDRDWNFATSLIQLSAVTAQPGWDYAFNLPPNFKRLVFVKDSSDRREGDDGIPYEVRDNEILTNHETTYLWYINGVYADQPGSWTQKFADALAAQIAERVYPATDEGNSVRDRIESAVVRHMRDAKALDARMDPIVRPRQSDLARARSQGVRSGRFGRRDR